MSADNGKIETNFDDFEEDWEGSQDMAMSAEAQAVLAAARALTAASTSFSTSFSSKKKPELPAFDKRNVEIWIKRVESAFTRSGVTSPQDKFAHLEPKFPVDYNPKINEFLFGEATEESWNSFIAYLKKEYGQTKRQQVSVMLHPFPRNNLRPSQQLASLVEKTNLLTIDDLRKEIIFKGLPADVKHSIVDKIDQMTASELAEAADKYFDREGKPLTASSAPVNVVEQEDPQRSVELEEEDPDVNAVGKYKGIGRRFGDSSNSGQKQRPSGNNGPSKPSSGNNSNNKTPKLCYAHNRYRDNAFTCKTTCPRYAEFVAKNPNKVKSGNGQATKRT